ncbi:MAG: class I SAM-dependent methyltransferase [Stellaceae bacterium]
MGLGRGLLLRMFGRPRGSLGRLGGAVMARTNRAAAQWVVGVLEPRAGDRVLEVGFGPGVAIEILAQAPARRVAGVDPSIEMIRQARARNGAAIAEGRIELRQSSAERLPFADASFDRALAINSMQVWSDADAGLRELNRVLRSGGSLALGFTVHSGQQRTGVAERMTAAGFAEPRIISTEAAFCALATKP